MTPSQETAFAEGGGGNLFSAANLLEAIASIGATAIIIYVAWLAYASYSEYGEGTISAGEMIWVWFRGVFMMMVILYLLIN